MNETAERRPIPTGLFGTLSFRIPADEYLAFKDIVAEHFKSDSDAAREALRLLQAEYTPGKRKAS